MAFKFANFAKTTLSVSASDVAEVLHVPPGEAGDFPVLGAGDKFSAVLYDGVQEPEIVYVTSASGGDLTVERAREDTAAKTWQVGTALAQVLTRDTISYIGGGMSDDTVIHLEERIDGAYAAVTIEATARATADSAMASLITTVEASVADNTAQIQIIALAQSDLNTAFASLSTTVTATANNALAIATSTATAFAGFQTAQAAINNSVQVQIDDAVASVNTEISARVAGDTALASSIATLNARVGSAEAAISAETTARVDAVAAVASSVTTLTATVGTNTAAITSESLTRATADSALSVRIDTLEATVGTDYATLNARIATEETVRASADTALASRATTLEANVQSGRSPVVNANFISYPTSPGIPTNWSDWANGATGTRVTGEGGGNGLQYVAPAGDGRGIQQLLSLAPGKYLLSAVAELTSGSWSGAGLVVDGMDSTLNFATDPDQNGAVSSSSIARRRFSKIITLSGSSARNIYALANWGGFDASQPAKTIIFYLVEIRALDAVGQLAQSSDARITTEETVRASADSALASSITSLSSTVSGNYSTLSAAISSESSTRASADTALASRATTLEAQMANTAGSGLQSRIATEESVRASGDSTNASAITTLSSTVGSLSSTVTTQATTIAQIDGYNQANYSVQLDSGGAFASFSLKAAGGSGSTGAISEFRVAAAKFQVDGIYPLSYDTTLGLLRIPVAILVGPNENVKIDGPNKRVDIRDDSGTLRARFGKVS